MAGVQNVEASVRERDGLSTVATQPQFGGCVLRAAEFAVRIRSASRSSASTSSAVIGTHPNRSTSNPPEMFASCAARG